LGCLLLLLDSSHGLLLYGKLVGTTWSYVLAA
jgi:hypothetical protein